MMKHSSITLTRTTTGWNATFAGEMEQEIRQLFGTDTIPTAFTAAAPAAKVLAAMTSRWKECSVRVQEAQ
jgi:hypothetical protein